MKNSFFLLLFLLPLFLSAQNEAQTGIHFENLPNWAAVKAKAKQENKYIFVDCFATWCGPCKKMDKEVYPIDSIGQLLNHNFVSVKLQMDSTEKDEEQIKKWYTDARDLKHEYMISVFPSYLFFTPDGKAVHKSIGFIDPTNFSKLVHDALDPKKQYYTQLEKFNQGKLAYADMPNFFRAANYLKDQSTANAVSKTYVDNYLLKLNEEELYTRSNLSFIGDFIQAQGSNDKAFKIFVANPEKIDSIIRPNYARSVVDYVVENEEVDKYFYRDGQVVIDKAPDWDKIRKAIKKKYGAIRANRVVTWAKIKWFAFKKDWPEYSKNVILKVENDGPYVGAFPDVQFPIEARLNDVAWELFLHSADSNDLEKALEWSKKALDVSPKPNGEYIDTYANLLYKLGRKEEALKFEEKAVEITPKNNDMKTNLEKMKKGEPTWPKD